MKVKTKTPEQFVVGLNRRELMIINNCLNEACSGLIMDRFLPVNPELKLMLKTMSGIVSSRDVFTFKPVKV
jgi:hypothetical protein